MSEPTENPTIETHPPNPFRVVLFLVVVRDKRSNSQPVLITSPQSLSGMSLEDRLLSYNWKEQFDSFQRVMRSGSFRAVCLDAQNNAMPVSRAGC